MPPSVRPSVPRFPLYLLGNLLLPTFPHRYLKVVLQAVTCSVFLSAVAHTSLLMASTGRRYILARYDPIFSLGFSAAGFLLLFVTIADAVLIAFRPVEDIDTAGFWCIVIFGMCLPMFLAGPLVVLQIVLPNLTRGDGSVVH